MIWKLLVTLALLWSTGVLAETRPSSALPECQTDPESIRCQQSRAGQGPVGGGSGGFEGIVPSNRDRTVPSDSKGFQRYD